MTPRFLHDFKTLRAYSSLFELFQSFFHLFDLVAAKAGPWSNKSESKAVKTAKRYYRIHAGWKGPFPSALFLRLFDIITPGGGDVGMKPTLFHAIRCFDYKARLETMQSVVQERQHGRIDEL